MIVNLVVDYAYHLYDGYLWTLTFADKRVENWPLMSSPKGTICWTLAYLLIVWFGPKFMKHRKPFDLRVSLVFFNLAMVALNFYIFAELLVVSWQANYDYNCQPVNYSNDPLELRIASALWFFYFSKLLEFMDTLFFILRKKFNQLSFLHVYHHSTMFCFWWIGMKWVAGGSAFLGAMLNSFVHIFMYAYYALSAAYPNVNFWWKKYLTVLQLVQFFIAIVQTVRGLRINCPFPRWMGYTLIIYMFSFIVLFGNYWIHAYIMPKKQKVKVDNNIETVVANGLSNNDKAPTLERSTNGFLSRVQQEKYAQTKSFGRSKSKKMT